MINSKEVNKDNTNSKKYADFGDLPSRYLIEHGKALVIERYSDKESSSLIGKRNQ